MLDSFAERRRRGGDTLWNRVWIEQPIVSRIRATVEAGHGWIRKSGISETLTLTANGSHHNNSK